MLHENNNAEMNRRSTATNGADFKENVIASRQNRSVVMLSKLDDKKYRDADKCFRYDGIKLFAEACRCGVCNVCVYLRESNAEAVRKKLSERGIAKIEDHTEKCLVVKDDVFDKISSEKSPEGIICVAKYIDKFHKIIKIDKRAFTNKEDLPVEMFGDGRILMLESVRDPGNLGTIIRSAYALGIDTVVMSSDCADIYNSKTIRAAMGALFAIKTVRTNDLEALVGYIRNNCQRRVFAATLANGAAPLGSFELKKSDIIVIGNEGHGLSQNIQNACDGGIYIPMRDGAESLNAAMAATVCIWEMTRAE